QLRILVCVISPEVADTDHCRPDFVHALLCARVPAGRQNYVGDGHFAQLVRTRARLLLFAAAIQILSDDAGARPAFRPFGSAAAHLSPRELHPEALRQRRTGCALLRFPQRAGGTAPELLDRARWSLCISQSVQNFPAHPSQAISKT